MRTNITHSPKGLWLAVAAVAILGGLTGCIPLSRPDDIPQMYAVPDQEAAWILAGEPIVFQDKSWFPADATEAFLDKEMRKLGQYKGVDFFVSREDVEPYERLFTKFDRNRYRYYQLRQP